jgi:DNA repair ATPase RecN
MSTYSDTILDRLNTTTEKFDSALDDFSDSYLNYKMYPDYNEYRQIYSNLQGVIDSLQADVFISTNDVQKNIENLNKLIKDLNEKIVKEKAKQTKLKTQLSQLTSNANGSSLLTMQAKTLYFDKYVYNTTLIVGILILFYSLFKVYAKKPQQMPTSV